MAVTSRLRATAALGEIWLQNWRVAGLLKPSAIKPVFATLEQAFVLRRLGHLDRRDEGALRIEIENILS
jgi:mRNA interferase MazF